MWRSGVPPRKTLANRCYFFSDRVGAKTRFKSFLLREIFKWTITTLKHNWTVLGNDTRYPFSLMNILCISLPRVSFHYALHLPLLVSVFFFRRSTCILLITVLLIASTVFFPSRTDCTFIVASFFVFFSLGLFDVTTSPLLCEKVLYGLALLL